MRIWVGIVMSLVMQGVGSIPPEADPAIDRGPEIAQAEDAARPSFAEFLAGVRTEALARGIREDIVDVAFSMVEAPLSIVIERDRTQAESILSLEDYLSRRLTKRQAMRAREGLARHGALLAEVATRYGIEPEILVAIWGLESNFGRFSGVRPTVAALATLAWDPRRSALFRSELFAALEILNVGDIEVSHMRGSWAGAMGQVQFMPSSYLKFAEDFDGDGRRDIWSSLADVFASIANYLKVSGWTPGQGWGQEVSVSQEAEQQIALSVARRQATCRAKRDMTVTLPMTEWQQLGVQLAGGRPLPTDAPEAALVSGSTRHFLVYPNYDALLDYNCSHSYAVSVGLLANRLGPPSGSTREGKPRKPIRRRTRPS